MPNAMSCPILRNSAGNIVIECIGGSPHNIGSSLIIGRIFKNFGAFFNESVEDTFRLAVLKRRIYRECHVLLANMNEGIHNSIAGLSIRQSKGCFGVEYTELGVDGRAVKSQFLLSRIS